MKLVYVESFNWKASIRGMRNPLESWRKSDTLYDMGHPTDLKIGKNDLGLMTRLSKAGSDHRKFMRQIGVSFDLTAPLYFWKQFDTYKISTVSNSCSTMHCIHKKPIAYHDFEPNDKGSNYYHVTLTSTIETLNILRMGFIEKGCKESWEELIHLLPSSYLQKRTITINYETVYNMYYARKNHKLKEWRWFIEQLMSFLPYTNELIKHERDTYEDN